MGSRTPHRGRTPTPTLAPTHAQLDMPTPPQSPTGGCTGHTHSLTHRRDHTHAVTYVQHTRPHNHTHSHTLTHSHPANVTLTEPGYGGSLGSGGRVGGWGGGGGGGGGHRGLVLGPAEREVEGKGQELGPTESAGGQGLGRAHGVHPQQRSPSWPHRELCSWATEGTSRGRGQTTQAKSQAVGVAKPTRTDGHVLCARPRARCQAHPRQRETPPPQSPCPADPRPSLPK